MPGTKTVLDLVVVPRARVGVLDEQPDRRPGRAPFEHSRKDAHLVALATLTDEMRCAGAAAVDVQLQILSGKLEVGRTAVHDATQGGTVALAKSRHREQFAYRVTGH